MSRFQFIDDTRTEFPVKRLCQVLGINRSSYYKYQATRPRRTARLIEDALLAARVITVFDAAGGCYGARRVTAELNDPAAGGGAAAAPVNRKRVARLMAAHRLTGFTKKRRVTTTAAEKSRRVFADRVHRDFTAEAPNQLYVGDITYLPIADGSNMYLATVIDCFSRQLVGFAIADHMRTPLVQEAISEAAGRRGNCGGLGGAVFHSDHGSVYTSGAFQKTCRDLKATQSMGTVGSSADNALAESFNAALKREVLRDLKSFATRWCAVGRSSPGVFATTPCAGIPGAGISLRRGLRRPGLCRLVTCTMPYSPCPPNRGQAPPSSWACRSTTPPTPGTSPTSTVTR